MLTTLLRNLQHTPLASQWPIYVQVFMIIGGTICAILFFVFGKRIAKSLKNKKAVSLQKRQKHLGVLTIISGVLIMLNDGFWLVWSLILSFAQASVNGFFICALLSLPFMLGIVFLVAGILQYRSKSLEVLNITLCIRIMSFVVTLISSLSYSLKFVMTILLGLAPGVVSAIVVYTLLILEIAQIITLVIVVRQASIFYALLRLELQSKQYLANNCATELEQKQRLTQRESTNMSDPQQNAQKAK